MPHAELKYSADLELDAPAALRRIEQILQAHDPGSGDCKGRAYPAAASHHTHLILEVSLLPKPHRDAAWFSAVRADLAAYLRSVLPRPCWLSIELSFSSAQYLTERLE